MLRTCTVTISLRTLAVCPAVTAGAAREPEFFNVLAGPVKRCLPEKGGNPQGISSSLRYMSSRTGYPHVNSSLTEESAMDNIAWLVPGPADGQRPRDSIISVASLLVFHLITSPAAVATRRTAHR
jgi:hypothetical protein